MTSGELMVPESSQFNAIEAAIGVITRPVSAMQQIAAARPWPIALGLTVAIGLLSGLASLTAPPQDYPNVPEGFVTFLTFIQSPAGVLVSALVFGPLAQLVGAGIYYLVGRLLGGRGPFSALLSTAGFASVPGVLLAPLTAVLNLTGIPVLGGLLGFAFGIWVFGLTALGIRESLGLSTGRAVATLLIPIGVLIVLSCVLVFAVVGLVASS